MRCCRTFVSRRTLILSCLFITLLLARFASELASAPSIIKDGIGNAIAQLRFHYSDWLPCHLTKLPSIQSSDYPSTNIYIYWESNCEYHRSLVEFQYCGSSDQNKPPSLTDCATWSTESIEASIHTKLPSSGDGMRYFYRSEMIDLDSFKSVKYRYSISHWRQQSLDDKLKAADLQSSLFDLRCIGRDCMPQRIALFADNQFASVNFRQVVGTLLHPDQQLSVPDVVVHVGDAVQDGTMQQWQTDFFDCLSPVLPHAQLLYVCGNHDRFVGGAPTGFHYLLHHNQTKGWRRIKVGRTIWYLLDANVDSLEQDRWMEEMFQTPEHRQASFRMVLCHIPPFIEYWDPIPWFNGENKVRYLRYF